VLYSSVFKSFTADLNETGFGLLLHALTAAANGEEDGEDDSDEDIDDDETFPEIALGSEEEEDEMEEDDDEEEEDTPAFEAAPGSKFSTKIGDFDSDEDMCALAATPYV
jgi:hypothetical protein